MKLLTGLLVVGVASVGSAQITKIGSGYTFKTKYTQGTKTVYQMGMQNSFAGTAMKVTTTMTQTVKSVKNGIATLVLTTSPPMMNGKPLPGTPGIPQTVTVQMDRNGTPVNGSSAMPSSNVMFPKTAIGVGGTWKSKVNLASTGLAGGSLDAVYRLEKITVYKGRPAALVGIRMSAVQPMSIKGTGSAYFALSDGSQLDSSITLNVVMSNPGSAPGATPVKVTAKVTITRKS